MSEEIIDQPELRIINGELKLKPIPAPVFPRTLMFFFAFLSMALPLFGVLTSIISGNGFHFGFIFGLALFGVIGFYLLRVALWNTYGEETLKFNESNIEYEANYGWFKDGTKQIPTEDSAELEFTAITVGYEDEKKGVLLIKNGNKQVKCATKLDIEKLEILIYQIHENYG